MLLFEGSFLSGSLSSLWPTLFGLCACLDFGTYPLFFLLSLSLGAFFFIKFGKVSSIDKLVVLLR